jgi:DNA-binding GntR family transcriptional regulator
MFIAALEMRFDSRLDVMAHELLAIYTAIIEGDRPMAHRLWREKFERWMRHFIGQLDGHELDAGLWSALIETPG